MIRTPFVSLALLLAIACGSKSAPAPATNPELTCAVDTDCVVVQKGCCSCAMGGDAVVINQQAAAVHPMKRACMTEDVHCPGVINESPACTGIPACQAGRCIAVPKPNPQEPR